MDYYSLLKTVEEDLKKQSREIADTFDKGEFSPKYITLDDGGKEVDYILILREIYGTIYKMIFPEKKNKYQRIKNVVSRIGNYKRLNKIEKKQEWILSKYFRKKIWNEETKEEKDNEKCILNRHDGILYGYDSFADSEEADILSVLDQYVEENQNLQDEYKKDLDYLIELWKEVKR